MIDAILNIVSACVSVSVGTETHKKKNFPSCFLRLVQYPQKLVKTLLREREREREREGDFIAHACTVYFSFKISFSYFACQL